MVSRNARFFLGSSSTLKYFPRIDLKACTFPSGPGHLWRQKVQGPGERGTGANCTCKIGSESSPASTGLGQCLGGGCMPLCSETCRVPSCYHNDDSQEVGWGRGCPASWHMALPSSTLGAGDSPSHLYGWDFPGSTSGKEPICQCRRHNETWVQSLGWEDPLEEAMATHSSGLTWRIPQTEEPGGLPPTGSQRVRHN